MSAPTWTVEDSHQLTAELVVRDGHHVNGDSLEDVELVAILHEAHQRHVTRTAVADRIGWKYDRLRSWAHRHGCYLSEDHFPRGALAWCTKDYYEQTQARKGFRARPIAEGKR
jgi:hypothetical protein